MTGALRRFADFFGLRRSIVGVLGMCILIGLGEKMAERFLPIYLVALGGGPWVVGALNSLDNLLSALYSYPGGWLSDRFGPRRALLIFNLIAIVGYLIVILFPAMWAVFLGAVLFISWTALSLPATMSLISEVLPKGKQTMGVSVHSLVRRLPMALGPVLGGFFITRYGPVEGVRLAFIGALAMAVVAIIFQEVMFGDQVPKEAPPAPAEAVAGAALLTPALRRLLVADVLVRFCEQIPYPFVVLWAMNLHGLTGVEFGILTAVEMATAVLIYIPVAWLADRNRKKPFVVATFAIFTAFPLVLWWSTSFWPLVFAFIVRGLKEFGEPTRKALILELAPEGRKAVAFGTYYLWRDVLVSVGALSGAWWWSISPATNFLVAAGFGLLGTLWFAIMGTDLPVEPSPEPAPGQTTA
ncbi:MAG: major facilitator superfamily transporter [Candidatus Ozemobacter sibiricus]|uniref:Major facilitator superfamily transporter n=1 Tax=Candidatus Ozemobacter sibiricus TaxID=2268124 RepID=A0A367ZD35_9BACT|nr:MAG: major facilitator superfamily transporter [Candidatus Ozemobacter sibiricus]